VSGKIKAKYPQNWKKFSKWVREVRAGGRCECTGECGLHRTNPGPRRCTERHQQPAQWAKGKVVLTTAHLCDCDPPCAISEHVKAMCNRCHLRIDVEFHINSKHRNRRLLAEQAGQMALVEARHDQS